MFSGFGAIVTICSGRRLIPGERLNPSEKLLEVPVALGKWFDLDIHAAGVAPRTVQEAMRHSTLDLTMNTYTDPRLLDLGGAVERLPELPLRPEREQVRANGTEDAGPPLTALLTYANGKRVQSRPLSDNL